MDGRADLPRVGAVAKGPSRSLPYVVTDAAGREVEPVSGYLRDLQLSDASPLTCRSYGYDLLRWFRLLWAVDVGWEQATERANTTTNRVRRHDADAAAAEDTAAAESALPTRVVAEAPPAPEKPPRPAGELSAAAAEEIVSAVGEVFAGRNRNSLTNYRHGMRRLLEILQQHPGGTWQERWEAAGLNEPGHPVADLAGNDPKWRSRLQMAAGNAYCMRLIRPTLEEDVVRHYQEFLVRRRAMRPEGEYRKPTDNEWADFNEHFDKRKVELGGCGRPYGTPCAHEKPASDTRCSRSTPRCCPASTRSRPTSSPDASGPPTRAGTARSRTSTSP